jgi:hypothetical protein
MRVKSILYNYKDLDKKGTLIVLKFARYFTFNSFKSKMLQLALASDKSERNPIYVTQTLV